jgi:hypothetical protein
MPDEGVEVAGAVRDEAQLEPAAPQLLEHRQDVLVQVEVLRALPGLLDLEGAFTRPLRVPAHPDHDPLREQEPDLLVVLELRMALNGVVSAHTRFVVARGVELEPVATANPHVSVRAQFRPGSRDGEVDVEENRSQVVAGHLYASGLRLASEGKFRRTSSSRARSSSAVITHSSSGACESTIPHGSAISERP